MYLSDKPYPRRARPIFCRLCGAALYREDFSLTFSKKTICESCISEITIQQLLRICEFSSKEDLLYTIGFTQS